MLCNFHTHFRRSGETALVSQSRPDGLGYSSLEYHPWHLPAEFSALPAELPEQLTHADALGEIGLDHLRGPSQETQLRFFRALLEMASDAGKPVVLHIVRARNEAFAELAHFPCKVLWHGFRGKAELLAELLARGYFVSLAPGSWRDPQIAGFFRTHPDRIGLETDAGEDLSLAELAADAEAASGCRTLEFQTEQAFGEFLQ